jgi:hypothetical protein
MGDTLSAPREDLRGNMSPVLVQGDGTFVKQGGSAAGEAWVVQTAKGAQTKIRNGIAASDVLANLNPATAGTGVDCAGYSHAVVSVAITGDWNLTPCYLDPAGTAYEVDINAKRGVTDADGAKQRMTFTADGSANFSLLCELQTAAGTLSVWIQPVRR